MTKQEALNIEREMNQKAFENMETFTYGANIVSAGVYGVFKFERRNNKCIEIGRVA